MVITYILVAANIAAMVWGGIKTFTGPVDKRMTPSEFGRLVGGIGAATNAIIQTLTNLCQLIASKYQIDLAVQRIEMDMIRMQMCMELNQHMLDVGQCRGREESCFNALLSCMNFGNVDNWMNSLNGVMNQVKQTTQQMGSSWNNFIFSFDNVYTGLTGGGYNYDTVFYIKGDDGRQSFEQCRYNGKQSDQSCKDNYVTFYIQDGRGICVGSKMRAYVEGRASESYGSGDKVKTLSLVNGESGLDKEHTFMLFCDRNNNLAYDSSDRQLSQTYQFKVKAGDTEKCECQ
jgi:hypothetical protein